MIETKEAIENLDEILSVPNLTGVYIGPADMSSSYGLKPKFDVKEDPVFSNIKLIAKKAKEYDKIAGIHNGTTQYAKQMITIGYQLVTVSSDFRAMTSYAQSVVDEMKQLTRKTNHYIETIVLAKILTIKSKRKNGEKKCPLRNGVL